MLKRRAKFRPKTRVGKPKTAAQPAQSAGDSVQRPRLQKVLAAAGLGSRRACEELIRDGRVEVNRRTIKELGTRVDPLHDEIRVDGEPLSRPRRQYFMLNKPMGVVSTARDPAGRPRVTDLVPSDQRLFPIGRLDLSSEGLILVTNDGEFANLLAHPRYEIEKTYLAQVVGVPHREALDKLERGVHLAEGIAQAKRVRIKSHHKHSAVLEVVLDEGRNREVRRLLARIGHKVLRLKRIAIGTLRLGELAAGEYRPLRQDEIRELKELALGAAARDKRPGRRSPTASKPARPITRKLEPAQENKPLADERFDDLPVGHHLGAIIGDDEPSTVGHLDRLHDADPTAPRKKTGSTVRPLIDVRRGIFPGAEADDLDEPDSPPPAPASARSRKDAGTRRGMDSGKKGLRRPTRTLRPPRGEGKQAGRLPRGAPRTTKALPAGEPARGGRGRKQRSDRAKGEAASPRPNRRKGRRR